MRPSRSETLRSPASPVCSRGWFPALADRDLFFQDSCVLSGWGPQPQLEHHATDDRAHMKVLVTGATGRLGSVVCKELLQRGHDVLATDLRLAAALAVPLKLADLRAPEAVYPLLEGREAVVHLGNISSLGAGPSPQVVLSDNVSMN